MTITLSGPAGVSTGGQRVGYNSKGDHITATLSWRGGRQANSKVTRPLSGKSGTFPWIFLEVQGHRISTVNIIKISHVLAWKIRHKVGFLVFNWGQTTQIDCPHKSGSSGHHGQQGSVDKACLCWQHCVEDRAALLDLWPWSCDGWSFLLPALFAFRYYAKNNGRSHQNTRYTDSKINILRQINIPRTLTENYTQGGQNPHWNPGQRRFNAQACLGFSWGFSQSGASYY